MDRTRSIGAEGAQAADDVGLDDLGEDAALGVDEALDGFGVDAFRLLGGDLAHDDLGGFGEAGGFEQGFDAQAVAFDFELL